MPHTKLFFPLVLMLSLVSCGSSKPEFSAVHYIGGLKLSNSGQYGSQQAAHAEKAFRKSIEKDSPLPAALSYEALLNLLYAENDFKSIISLTDTMYPPPELTIKNISVPDSDAAERLRLAALLRQEDKRAEELASKRFFSTAFTAADRKLFENPELSGAVENLPESVQNALQFRIAFVKRDYVRALKILKEQTEKEGSAENKAVDSSAENSVMLFFDLYRNFPVFLEVCASILYGSRNTAERLEFAEALENAALFFTERSNRNGENPETTENVQKAFYCGLYAARLYARCGETYRSKARSRYEQTIAYAAENALENEDFDKVLWYYLDSLIKTSNRSVIAALQIYAPQWHDASYFDDILSLLSYNLLTEQNYKGYYAVYENLSPYMSQDMLSKYAFIAGRLGETGLLGADFPQEKIKAAFKKSYEDPDGSLYYRLLAAERLDIPFNDIQKSLLRRKKKRNAEPDAQAELLLKECIAQGMEQHVYPLFVRFKEGIGQNTAAELSKLLAQKELYPKALRTAVHSFGKSDDPIKQSQLEMLYPRFYKETVENLCARYELPEYLAYALIRSESFFDKDIRSHAGAVGLTQLMESTAADIARKLKIRTYDISEPALNAEFGIFYLKELIGRLDNSVLLALFSYNAGITKVRRWNAANSELSKDLLLEVLPYKETREYGQKILTAAALYACLYCNKTTHDIVREIMQ